MAHILITNDDGIHAEGLRALAEGLAGLGRISIVAPNRERSAAAQSLTLRQPIVCEQRGENEWAVEGTPADAVIVALHKLLPEPPDLVVSGINLGPNMNKNDFSTANPGAIDDLTQVGTAIDSLNDQVGPVRGSKGNKHKIQALTH